MLQRSILRNIPLRLQPAYGVAKNLQELWRNVPSQRVRNVSCRNRAELPQGARLIGIYDSHVTHGQSRVLMVWTRLIMPNGRSIVLERQPGADTAGYAGLHDEVDLHWGELFKAALLSTLLGVGAELGSGSDAGNGNSAILQALRRGARDSLNQTGQQVVRRNLNIQPTLTIRPGFPVRVIVNRDLVLEPYRG
jgi:type IV secretion system protein VirB10